QREQLEFRPDQHPGRVHANHADHVPVQLLGQLRDSAEDRRSSAGLPVSRRFVRSLPRRSSPPGRVAAPLGSPVIALLLIRRGTMRFRASHFLGALVVVSVAATVFGQGFQGGIRGSIKDTGGVVPGVEVTLTNESTNIARTTATNERGEYVFASVI